MKVLSLLPALERPATGKLQFPKVLPPPPKVKFSVVDMKKVTKVLEGLGKTVIAIDVLPGGGFRVSALGKLPPKSPTSSANPWDEVLDD